MKLLCSNTKNLKISTMNNNNEEFSIPINLCAQASQAAQFSLLVRPVNPRRQNIRALARFFPRLWGMDDIVTGWVVEHGRAQFLFPSNEAMNLVLKRGPWSFNQWMVAMDPWHLNVPNENPIMINLWVQIRDIPLQYLSVQMVNYIAETLGIVTVRATEATLGGNNEFGRVCIYWPLYQSLVFERNFLFGLDSATVTFHYKRLRNHCFRCKSLQHDVADCEIPEEEAANGHQDPEPEDDMIEELDLTSANNGHQRSEITSRSANPLHRPCILFSSSLTIFSRSS
ncbi:hypothetical protein V5N11_000960 [Cardamine amara subsp. amara]|uniref:DUF4283 domain-containing protein n=1 Tax=Cardamine amara subsp. amara TaxID=228776 RepID=A0ABD1C584_CARAN